MRIGDVAGPLTGKLVFDDLLMKDEIGGEG